MPVLCGEGGAKAFLRLQQEISKQSDDESLSQIWKTKIYGRYAALPKDPGSIGIIRPIYIEI